MKQKSVTIIDYGMGNIWSVASALKYLNVDVQVSDSPIDILSAESLLLPGVGSFRKAMDSLRRLKLDLAIIEAVLQEKRKILGICLGMQLMSAGSTEDGETLGLNLIPTQVEEFSKGKMGALKVPHVGFDQVNAEANSNLYRDIEPNSDFYFVHSYRLLADNLPGKLAVCNYGENFLAGYEQDNIFATQFHPEKSQTNGLILLRNFLEN